MTQHSPTETAAAMRRALKAAFPGVTFRLTCDRGTAWGWMSLSWTDGPTVNTVRTVLHPFQSAHFDGMDDSMHFHAGSQWTCYGYGPSRNYSPAALALAAAQVAADPSPWVNDYDSPGETYYAERMFLEGTDLT